MKKTFGWIIFVGVVTAIIGLILSWDGPSGKSFPELSSRFYCGGCSGVEVEVMAKTSVTLKGDHWVYGYEFLSKSGPVRVTVNLKSEKCEEWLSRFTVTGFDLDGCNLSFDLSNPVSFSSPKASDPEETDATMLVKTLDGKDLGGGRLAFYAPAN